MAKHKFDSLIQTANYSQEDTIRKHTEQAEKGQIHHGDSNVSTSPKEQGIGNNSAIYLARQRLVETQQTGVTSLSEGSITDIPTLSPEEILVAMREKMRAAMEAKKDNN
jgi:hypothetical protein